MTKIFDDIFAFIHPKGANCNVYVLKDGNDLDMIDSGVGISLIFRWLLKAFRHSGLDPANVRNIFHCHVHFDHVGADKAFQKIASKNHKTI
jgi:glyoxylase-like metal-dependent hydrolase (beta-lactamase superfamily II)